jgi:septum formation protein
MGATLPFRLTLASGSIGRRWLLEKAGYTFDVIPANIDEPTEAAHGSCRQYVQHVSWLKAAAVAPVVAEGVVLAADTVGWIDGAVIGKPVDANDARRILRTLAGRVHELWTGVCLWRIADGFQLCWQERTLVRMKPFTQAELDAYIATNRWVGCSGAYAIEETNDPYLVIEDGSLSNVVGLPMESLARALKWIGNP